MSKILLIGNSGFKNHGTDGQTVKVRLYLKKIKDEGFDVDFVDLECFTKKIISTLHRIKKGIKSCDRIVLITARRGCKFLIPYINLINKKYKKIFVLPLIGTSVLHYSLDKLNDEDKRHFLLDKNYSLCQQNKKMSKQLSKIDYILPETDDLVNAFRGYFCLDNVFKLNNFREFECGEIQSNNKNNAIKLVYLSRVTQIKGIFDLIEVVSSIAKDHHVSLDIYGLKTLSKEENNIFDSYIDNSSINYRGAISSDLACHTLSKYDLLVFPTRYFGEGTPGVIAESLLVGTPILTSDFPQVFRLLNDGIDSVFYKMLDKEDLKTKLLYIIRNNNVLLNLRNGALESGKKYTYSHERSIFLKYICGVNY